jgi:hypothetical protein
LTDIQYITLIVVGVLTWLVFILGVAKFSKFCLQFIVYRKDLDINLTGMGSSVKKLQNSISEMILEQRRTNKLMLELIDSSKSGIDENSSGDLPIEYQVPESQNSDSPFIFHGNESQLPKDIEGEFIFHGNESQHQ